MICFSWGPFCMSSCFFSFSSSSHCSSLATSFVTQEENQVRKNGEIVGQACLKQENKFFILQDLFWPLEKHQGKKQTVEHQLKHFCREHHNLWQNDQETSFNVSQNVIFYNNDDDNDDNNNDNNNNNSTSYSNNNKNNLLPENSLKPFFSNCCPCRETLLAAICVSWEEEALLGREQMLSGRCWKNKKTSSKWVCSLWF